MICLSIKTPLAKTLEEKQQDAIFILFPRNSKKSIPLSALFQYCQFYNNKENKLGNYLKLSPYRGICWQK